MKYIISGMVLLTLASCGLNPTKKPCPEQIRTVTTYVPVSVVPKELKEIPIYERPVLLTDQLTKVDANDPDKVLKALTIDVFNLRNYAENLESNERTFRSYTDKLPSEVPPSVTK